jgi:hypothetical protein
LAAVVTFVQLQVKLRSVTAAAAATAAATHQISAHGSLTCDNSCKECAAASSSNCYCTGCKQMLPEHLLRVLHQLAGTKATQLPCRASCAAANLV